MIWIGTGQFIIYEYDTTDTLLNTYTLPYPIQNRVVINYFTSEENSIFGEVKQGVSGQYWTGELNYTDSMLTVSQRTSIETLIVNSKAGTRYIVIKPRSDVSKTFRVNMDIESGYINNKQNEGVFTLIRWQSGNLTNIGSEA